MIAQLQLELGDRSSRVPWGGKNPRDLTRARLGVILKARAREERERISVDPWQIDMFSEGRRRGPRYEGAPLLVPLSREKRDGETEIH